MPSRKRKNGTSADIAFPVDAATRRVLEETVIAEYARMLGASVMPRSLRAR